MADTSVKGMIEPIPNYKPGSMSGVKIGPIPNYKPGSIGTVDGMLNPVPYSDKTLDKDRIRQLIMEQATARGVDPAVALRIAERESSLNPTAKNRLSSAYGLFQIIDPTWERYGGTKENRTSVLDNIRIGIDIIADNEKTYIKKVGRAPSAAELYSMHFLGSTGGPRVLSADPNSPLSSVVSPKVIKQNPDLRGKTVGEFIASMQRKMGAVGDTALARRSVKEQGPGTVPMPQGPKETIRGRERLQPLAQDMVEQLGPNYQAALAAMALADTREDEEDDENSLSRQYREQIAAQETEDIFSTPQRIAGLELGFQSPFPEEQQPLMMKDGGEARLSTTFGESAVPENAAEYAKFLEASKKSKVPAPLPAMLKEKIFDPLTKGGLQDEGVYYDTMTPQPITSKSPTTLFAGVPGAKVVELGGLQDTTLSGFVFARPSSSKGKMVEDVVFVAPPYSKRASDILFRRAPERWVENPNQELERQVLLGHETEHLLKRRGNRDINETFDQLAKQAREEDFIGSFFKKPASALRSKFVKDAAGSASYLKDKFGVTLPSYFDPKKVGTYTFHEQVATLAGIEQAFGVDLTQDPVLRKTLFEDPDVRRAYSAVTGLRQTRLDPRDLPPYTLQPDIPYNPKAAEIRTKPVKKANGGEMFADPMGVPDSGPITADTRKALTTRQGLSAAEMMRMLQNVGREGVSNLESLARGSVSAVPGVVGDIESIFRDDKNRRFATTKEVERQYLPKRLTAPTKESEGFVEAGTFIDPTIALKAAKPVARGAAALGKSFASTTEKTAADMLEKMAPVAKPFYMVQEASPPVTPPINFSSRLDDFVSQQKSPMNKSQFLGTLKGKFRDYDILRAEEALADLPDTQKLSPSDISNRLAAKYPVKDYKYSIVNPKNDAEGIERFFNTSDNPYKGQPLGVITLSVTPTEEAAKKSAMMDNVFAALTKLRDEKFVSKEEQKLILDAIENAPPEAKQVMQATLDLYNKSPIPVLVKARELYVYPNLYSPETWKVALNDTYQELWPQTMTGQMDKVTLGRISVEKANEAVYREADALMKDFNLPVLERRDPGITFTGTDFDKAFESFYPLAQTAAMGVREGLNNFARAGGTAKLEREALYKGQHTSVTGNIDNPVGFSRFSDHLVKLPDLGRIKVMYVNELQSDLYDDLMKKGPVTRDKLKDVEEAVDLSNQAYMTALKTFGEDDGSRLFSEIQSGIAGTKYKPDMEKLTETYGEKVKNVVPELLSMLKRSQTLNKRAGLSGDYTKQEAFAGMERSPQVVQQLLIKNVIGAGIDRGVNAVAFPGKESAQAQLYEKLPNNLKQAVKDLGPGFEIRPITLTDFEGKDVQHLAVVWGKEAADRIRNKGIPFKKGGMVEKSDYDNRKYI